MCAHHYALVAVLALGCAAQPATRPDADLSDKQEALVGASCVDDSGCDAWEHCNRIVCITTPCPSEGTCANITRWYDNDGPTIPDAEPAGVSRVITVDRPASTVAQLHIGVNIEHSWRGDLSVTLRSPAGTEHVLHDREGGSADNLNINVDLPVFEGETAVGDWTLTIRDHARQDIGRLLSWRLEFDYAEAAPTPTTGTNVWSQVVVPTIQSAHEYANDTNQTWDLRPFSAGAARARIAFARLDTEANYDFVEVLDMDSGDVLDRFTGNLGAYTTREYETGNLGIRLVSDYSVVAYGFEMQHVEVFGLGCLDDDDCDDGFECPNELVRCIRFPCFLSCRPSRPGVEGDGCMNNAGCENDLYCGDDGFCHSDGSCEDYADCNMPGNNWVRLRCLGFGSCTDNQCGWNCGAVCVDGDTRDDGCNTCSCREGRWLCTERYCPPVALQGETCGAGTVCDEGLLCNQARTTDATCTSDQLGTCIEDGPRICTAEYRPVCACNGQTFSNDCRRGGIAAFAHDGACELSVAIPDANSDGIAQTLVVSAPTAGRSYAVSVEIEHTWRGDLVVWVTDPDGERHVLSNREGRSDDDFSFQGTFDVGASGGLGNYTLHVSDHASRDTGVLRFFNVQVR